MPSKDNDDRESDASRWLDDHGDMLFRYALTRVRSREIAEDLVQETFVAAIGGVSQFQGKANIQTWLVSILRRKIVDYFRRQEVERKAKGIQENTAGDAKSYFSSQGHWRKRVKRWPTDPQQDAEVNELWRILDDCCQQLPATLATAFQLRELEQLSSEEVCKLLAISSSNLGVRLHRARLLLRDCLEKNWIDRED